jgi:hypothetical protein
VQPDTVSTACIDCVVGKVQPLTGTTGCVDCAVGTFQPSTGATACANCATGQVQPLPAQTDCTACEVGQYKNTEGHTECDECASGKYQDQTGRTVCTFCAIGQIQPSPGWSTCVNCAPGLVAAQEGMTVCGTCQVGKYQGSINCDDCEVGRFQPDEGRSVCLECAPGQYQGSTGTTVCIDCDVGRVTASDAMSECVDCAVGKIQTGTGTSACVNCVVGKIQPSQGTTVCADCATGQIQPTTGMTACIDCAVGFVQPSVGRTICVECPVGEIQPSQGQTACADCAAGRSQPLLGQTACNECEAGKIQPLTGATECIDCEAGKVKLTAGATTPCVDCPIGEVQPETGKLICNPCERGKYQGSTGQTECAACAPAADSCDDGQCDGGTHAASEGQTSCTPATVCPAGTHIDFAGDIYDDRTCVTCEAESFSDRADAPTCAQWNSCAGGAEVTFTGVMEGLLVPGSVTNDITCEACPEGKISLIDDYYSPCVALQDSDGDGKYDRFMYTDLREVGQRASVAGRAKYVPSAEYDKHVAPPTGGEYDECPFDAANDEDADGICAGETPEMFRRLIDADAGTFYAPGGSREDECPTDSANDADKDGVCDQAETDKTRLVTSQDFLSNSVVGWQNAADAFRPTVPTGLPALPLQDLQADERVRETCELAEDAVTVLLSQAGGEFSCDNVCEQYAMVCIEAKMEHTQASDGTCPEGEVMSELAVCVPKPWDDYVDCYTEQQQGKCPCGADPNGWVAVHCPSTCSEPATLLEQTMVNKWAEGLMKDAIWEWVLFPTQYECTTDYNFIPDMDYSQISLTDGCANGVCDANPVYAEPCDPLTAGTVPYAVPCTEPQNSIEGATEYCKARCAADDACTGFFFQKHTNGHEICGFYSTDMSAGTMQADGHAAGSCICMAERMDSMLPLGVDKAEIEAALLKAERQEVLSGAETTLLATAFNNVFTTETAVALLRNYTYTAEGCDMKLDMFSNMTTGVAALPLENSKCHHQHQLEAGMCSQLGNPMTCKCGADPAPIKTEPWSQADLCPSCYASTEQDDAASGSLTARFKIYKNAIGFNLKGKASSTSFVKMTLVNLDAVNTAKQLKDQPFIMQPLDNLNDGWYAVEWDVAELKGETVELQISDFSDASAVAVDNVAFYNREHGCLPTCMAIEISTCPCNTDSDTCVDGQETCFYFELDSRPYLLSKSLETSRGIYCRDGETTDPGSLLGPGLRTLRAGDTYATVDRMMGTNLPRCLDIAMHAGPHAGTEQAGYTASNCLPGEPCNVQGEGGSVIDVQPGLERQYTAIDNMWLAIATADTSFMHPEQKRIFFAYAMSFADQNFDSDNEFMHCLSHTLDQRCVAFSNPANAFKKRKKTNCLVVDPEQGCLDKCFDLFCQTALDEDSSGLWPAAHGNGDHDAACGTEKGFHDCAECCEGNNDRLNTACFTRRRRRLREAVTEVAAVAQGDGSLAYDHRECATLCLNTPDCVAYSVQKGYCSISTACDNALPEENGYRKMTWQALKWLDDDFFGVAAPVVPKKKRRRKKSA